MTSRSIGRVRCAIYTRVSTDQGLDQDFNSLDAQYEASSAYIKSQAHAGWTLLRSRYDDGGYSGGSTDRPNLQQLLQDVRDRKIDVIVVYFVRESNVREQQTRAIGLLHPAPIGAL
jgi:site-specific DNA recombinase